MITRVFGKKIENVYDVDHKWMQIKDENGDVKTVYIDKPTITKIKKVKEWCELCSYKGEPRYNSETVLFFGSYKKINISEDEEVSITKEIFRADINETHLHTDKVVEITDVNKEDALSILDGQIKSFNKMMIESNDTLKAYCDLHKLSYEDTDCIELFKVVFPNEEYEIVDGVMRVKKKYRDDWAVVCSQVGLASTGNDISTAIATKYDDVEVGGISSRVSNL